MTDPQVMSRRVRPFLCIAVRSSLYSLPYHPLNFIRASLTTGTTYQREW